MNDKPAIQPAIQIDETSKWHVDVADYPLDLPIVPIKPDLPFR